MFFLTVDTTHIQMSNCLPLLSCPNYRSNQDATFKLSQDRNRQQYHLFKQLQLEVSNEGNCETDTAAPKHWFASLFTGHRKHCWSLLSLIAGYTLCHYQNLRSDDCSL